ncbi:MAG: hypothetical protein M5U26_23145 [Planctomycetota bacterium]|nr:hypothetical protein [Planctomycetota bacterium]
MSTATQINWNVDHTIYDRLRKTSRAHRAHTEWVLTAIRALGKNQISEGEINAMVRMASADHLFEKLGRRRWFIDKEVATFLLNLEVDADPNKVFLPYDAFSLVFEQGTEIEGIPLRWIRIVRPRSQIALDIEMSFHHELRAEAGLAREDGDAVKDGESSAWCFVEQGESPPGTFSHTAPWEKVNVSRYGFGKYRERDDREFMRLRQVIAAVVQYFKARPDFVPEFTLPRSQRFALIGDRTNIHRVMLPSVRYVPGVHQGQPLPGGWVSPHIRGWVLRRLMHRKYYTSDEAHTHAHSTGDFRTILVEPCIIHKEVF